MNEHPTQLKLAEKDRPQNNYLTQPSPPRKRAGSASYSLDDPKPALACQPRRTFHANQEAIRWRIGAAIWVLVAVSFVLAAVAWGLLLREMP